MIRPDHRGALRRSLIRGVLVFLVMPQLCAWAASADELYSRGLKEYMAGNYDDATGDLQQALKQDPNHDDARHLLGTIEESRRKETSNSGVVAQLTETLKSQEVPGPLVVQLQIQPGT